LKPDAEVEHFYASILAKYRMIITNLEDLILTVTLAKINLISIDIKELSNEQLTNTSITDLLEVSHIKAFQKYELLYFLIKYPKPLLSCKKKIDILPVQHNNIILDLEEGNTVACGCT